LRVLEEGLAMMKAIFGTRRLGSDHPAADAPDTRLLSMTRTMRQAYLQLFGIPDYERYAEHMAARHPGVPLLSRREFCAQAIDRKYARNGPRCC
jgi:uncharacterized short protein YbdD (DUF466 family)